MHSKTLLAFMAACLGGLALSSCGQPARTDAPAKVTFTKSVAPILYKHCAECHHSGGIGPMPLLTYAQVKPFSPLIRDRVTKRIMPPWLADSPMGKFSNDPSLSKAEIHTIATWVDEGAPEGDPKSLPPQPKFSGGWEYGQPDVVFPMAKEQTIPAHGRGWYKYFKIPTHFKHDKWIHAIQLLPSNARVVHHAGVGFYVPAPGYTFKNAGQRLNRQYMYKVGTLKFVRADAPVVNDGCSSPTGGRAPHEKQKGPSVETAEGDIFTYLPGRPAEQFRPGYAFRVPAGAVLTLQMHYMPMGQVEKDRTRVGLWFAKGPVKKQVKLAEFGNNLFKIPAGAPDVRVTECRKFRKDVQLLSYVIHMHYRGKDATVYAIYPDGKQETLLSVPHYNFNWQLQYNLKTPKSIPKGTVIKTVTHFDNSKNNPLNPDPAKTIRWGEPSDSEMDITYLLYVDQNSKPSAELSAKR